MSEQNLPLENFKLTKENKDLVKNFSCGNINIDDFIKQDSVQTQNSGEGVTYLVIDKIRDRLVGYYTLATTSLLYSATKVKNDYRIEGDPAVEIKMFAVNEFYQGYNPRWSDNIMADIMLGIVIAEAYKYALNHIGFKFIVLDSTDEAISFYQRNGFNEMDKYISLYSEFTEGCTPMYMRLFE